jgi:hypothetical protein
MPDLCSSCGVEPAMPRWSVCRFCDPCGWRPIARPAAAAEPDESELGSPWWEVVTTGLCGLAGGLLLVFLELIR